MTALPPFVVALTAVFVIEAAIFGAYAAWLLAASIDGYSTGVGSTHLGGAHRLQPEGLQPLGRRALGLPVPAAHSNPTFFEAAYLIARVVWMNQRAAVEKAEQRQIYFLVPIFGLWTPQ